MTVTSFSLLLLRFVMFTSVFQTVCDASTHVFKKERVCVRTRARVRAADIMCVKRSMHARMCLRVF